MGEYPDEYAILEGRTWALTNISGEDTEYVRVDLFEALQAQLATQQAIIDKLPKTADGVGVSEGDIVFRETRTTGEIEEHDIRIIARAVIGKHCIDVTLDDCYSTREAAEAAMINTDKMTPEELVRFLAVEVMECEKLPWIIQDGVWWRYDTKKDMMFLWNPLTNANDTFMVTAAMMEKGFGPQCVIEANGLWMWIFRTEESNWTEHRAVHKDFKHAVCRAAAKAIQAKEEQD